MVKKSSFPQMAPPSREKAAKGCAPEERYVSPPEERKVKECDAGNSSEQKHP